MHWLEIVAPIVGPLVVGILKRLTTDLPKWFRPVLATALGTIVAALGGADPVRAVTLGMAGIGVREIVDQVRQGLGLK